MPFAIISRFFCGMVASRYCGRGMEIVQCARHYGVVGAWQREEGVLFNGPPNGRRLPRATKPYKRSSGMPSTHHRLVRVNQDTISPMM